MIGELVLATGVALIVYALYKLSTNSAQYFEERNLKYIGAFTGMRNFFDMFMGRNDFLVMTQRMYNAFPNEL